MAAPPAPPAAYPLEYPVLDAATHARRTEEVRRRNPGWSVELDATGLLGLAECLEACGITTSGPPEALHIHNPSAHDKRQPLSANERIQLDAFLDRNEDVLWLKAPGAKEKFKTKLGARYEQAATFGTFATVQASYADYVLEVRGHLWPNLPPAADQKTDDELLAVMRLLDPTPDLLLRRGYSLMATSMNGPVQFRETACAYYALDDLGDWKQRPHRPCLDARTGQEITSEQALMWRQMPANKKIFPGW